MLPYCANKPNVSKDADSHKNISFIPGGSSVAVQQEDWEPWMCGTIVRDG